jgi:mannose-6-phosphate isomerase-like protein (cupin superfamily)
MFSLCGAASFVVNKRKNMETLMKEDVFTDKLENKASIIQPGDGSRIHAGEGSCTFKITSDMTGGRLGIYEIVVPPRTVGARLHYHRYMDEVFIVNMGILTVDFGDETHHLTSGTTVYIPRFTPHGFSNNADEALVITLIFNPSEHREGYFNGLFELLQAESMDIPRFLQLAQKYDTHPLNVQPQ